MFRPYAGKINEFQKYVCQDSTLDIKFIGLLIPKNTNEVKKARNLASRKKTNLCLLTKNFNFFEAFFFLLFFNKQRKHTIYLLHAFFLLIKHLSSGSMTWQLQPTHAQLSQPHVHLPYPLTNCSQLFPLSLSHHRADMPGAATLDTGDKQPPRAGAT